MVTIIRPRRPPPAQRQPALQWYCPVPEQARLALKSRSPSVHGHIGVSAAAGGQTGGARLEPAPGVPSRTPRQR